MYFNHQSLVSYSCLYKQIFRLLNALPIIQLSNFKSFFNFFYTSKFSSQFKTNEMNSQLFFSNNTINSVT